MVDGPDTQEATASTSGLAPAAWVLEGAPRLEPNGRLVAEAGYGFGLGHPAGVLTRATSSVGEKGLTM